MRSLAVRRETVRTILRAGSVAILLGAASPAVAQTPVSLTISGNQAQGTISLSGDVGADLTIAFESPGGLTPTALEVTATLVDPLDPALLARLPALTSIPSAFPVLVTIRPDASSGLTFSSVATVSLHTHNLAYNPLAPQSLLKAHDGGSFLDVTTSDGAGSYRVNGSTGDFSEFLIVADSRAIDAVIVDKFDALQTTLAVNAATMPPLVLMDLQLRLTAARALYLAGALLPAIDSLTTLESDVVVHTGVDIPGVWEAADPALINVAGLLRSGIESLELSLDRRAGL
jgi:hypothetical protein